MSFLYPSPYDAKGLLVSAIRSQDPVVVFEPSAFIALSKKKCLKRNTIPFGQADVADSAEDITLIGWGAQHQQNMEAAQSLSEQEGIEVEVLNLRTLNPLDINAITCQLKKQAAAWWRMRPQKRKDLAQKFGAVMEKCFLHLEAPVKRCCGLRYPFPAHFGKRISARRIKSRQKSILRYSEGLKWQNIHTVNLPDIGEGVVEGEVIEWLKNVGDTLAQDEPVVVVMTDKATVELPAPYPGKLAKQYYKVGEIAIKDKSLYDIALEQKEGTEESTKEKPLEKQTSRKVKAAPPVRKLARDLNIDINLVKGTGSDGRVTREDIAKVGHIFGNTPRTTLRTKKRFSNRRRKNDSHTIPGDRETPII